MSRSSRRPLLCTQLVFHVSLTVGCMRCRPYWATPTPSKCGRLCRTSGIPNRQLLGYGSHIGLFSPQVNGHSLIFDIIQMAFQILENSFPTNSLTCGTKSVVLENVLGFTRVLDVVLEHIEKELSQILGSNWYETLNYSVFSGQMQPKTRKETQGTLQHGWSLTRHLT